MTRRVVVTGVGTISALGNTATEFRDALAAGRSGIGALGDEAHGTRIGVGAMVRGFDPAQHFPEDDLPLLDRFSQFAVVAGREALRDAGLEPRGTAIQDAAAIIGTGCGGKQTDEETYARLYKEQKERAHALTIPKGMPSAAASMVSMHLGIRGPVFSVTSACASGAHAAAQGMLMIQSGLVDVALVGGSDAPFTYGLLRAWEALRVVSNDTCRPFCKDRSGMVLGEGAGMLVLESADHARARNARPLAELAGFGMSSDAGHITRPSVDGIARAIANALVHASLQPQSIGYVNAHGTGTPANDPAETAALRQVLGERAFNLAVSSTKSMHGHALGASSALELIATVFAVRDGLIPPTANFTEADPECDLDYVPNVARNCHVDVALSNSFAFGGLNVVLAVRSI